MLLSAEGCPAGVASPGVCTPSPGVDCASGGAGFAVCSTGTTGGAAAAVAAIAFALGALVEVIVMAGVARRRPHD